MAVRPTWQGHLRLSLVTCPVALFKATESRTGISFNLINPKTNSRVKQVLKDASTGEAVERSSLVKGFAVAKDEYVLIEPEEIDSLKIESSDTIDIERFVDGTSIDRIYWDEPYYLLPDGKTGAEAYAVIREAMAQQGKVGIGRLVLSQRERIVALEPRDERILVTTLRSHDEVRDIADLAGAGRDVPKPTKEMLQIARQIIDQNSGDFAPAEFVDSYEAAVRGLIEGKRKGKKPVRTPSAAPSDSDNVIDLMEALRRSIGAPSRRRANDNAARAVAARRSSPKKTGPKAGRSGRAA
jgi:DNA end-binding protein Ku